MNDVVEYLKAITLAAEQANHRFAVKLSGSKKWRTELYTTFILHKQYHCVFKLGGSEVEGAKLFPFNKGQQVLGEQCQCLIYDDADGFDANSFAASTGSLQGGGIFLFNYSDTTSLFASWLEKTLTNLICISQNSPLPPLPPLPTLSKAPPKTASTETRVMHTQKIEYHQQQQAVELIEKVVTGHRKRPLVLTADRGRGKSSALGIAAAKLMSGRKMRILVTAPSKSAVKPLFTHASLSDSRGELVQPNLLKIAESELSYIAVDELIASLPKCDLLLIDEAAAIPLTLLEKIIVSYHRVALATTVHGYEGCGRGFSLKFFPWLDENRAGWKNYHMTQPIRWAEDDPLERWVFQLFLLNAQQPELPINISAQPSRVEKVTKTNLLEEPIHFKHIFALLVNAHYQTTPNDLVQILLDDSLELYALSVGEHYIGCALCVTEGGMTFNDALAVVSGIRRPKGHLAAALIASQLAIPEAMERRCSRIMRIAVHTQVQNQGFGTLMLAKVVEQLKIDADYIATCYGVTSDLLTFWKKNGFAPVRLGSGKDQASGTYSLLMVRQVIQSDWLTEVISSFTCDFIPLLSNTFKQLEPNLVASLLRSEHASSCQIKSESALSNQVSKLHMNRIGVYAKGGSSYESNQFALRELLIASLAGSDHPWQKILISKVLQQHTWSELSQLYGFSGRKQAEIEVRRAVSELCQFTL